MPYKSFRRGATSSKSIRPLKLTVVGDGNVGKTSLLMSFTLNNFPEDYVPTVFDTHQKNVVCDQFEFGLSLWDTAGHEKYNKLRPLSYPKTDCFIICYSVTNKDSLDNVEAQWYPELIKNCPHTAMIVVGTKLDQRKDCPEHVTEKQGRRMKTRVKAQAFIECSARTGENLERVFQEAVRATMKKKKDGSSFCSFL